MLFFTMALAKIKEIDKHTESASEVGSSRSLTALAEG